MSFLDSRADDTMAGEGESLVIVFVGVAAVAAGWAATGSVAEWSTESDDMACDEDGVPKQNAGTG